MTEESLFAAALERATDAERRAFLAEAAAGDDALRRRVERLLAADGQAEGPLDGDPDGGAAVPGPTVAEAPGDCVGRYKLREQIGEGGFGLVFVAEQTEPVRRKVAVKVIKPGMDTREVVARFEAERQALALMDHPHIAKVLDGGTTESGRPYFVMELVRGVPLTDYCDRNRLPTCDRLDLFVAVCRAVQHAHQKGVIHRDLKPSNILVTLYDGVPVAKVIDFGVAKALNRQLTEHSVYTRFAQMVGTPTYMSPEQAELSGLDVDTRADIYSLGVLLYELLTGTTPFEKERLKTIGFDEIRRIIREEEPPKPSTRVSTLGRAAATVSANRRCDPRQLSRSLRGELDWIVMKALEKDRNRRFESAADLARDVERYLRDEPVEASPPSTAYRLRKFLRRNRGPVLAAAVILLALSGGGVGTTIGLIRAETQRHRAESAAEAERAARESAQNRLTQIEKGNEILGAIFRDVDPRSETREGKPLRPLLGDRLEAAANQLDADAVGDPVAVARLQQMLGTSLHGLGYADKAVPLLAKARATFAAHLGADHLDTVRTTDYLALAYTALGRGDLALPLHQDALRLVTARYGPDSEATLHVMHNLASGYRSANKPDLAISLLEETLQRRTATLGRDDVHTLQTMNNLGLAYVEARKLDRALPLLRETVERRRARLGPEHIDYLGSLNNLAMAYRAADQMDLALPRFQEVVRLVTAKLGPDHPHTLTSLNNLAFAYRTAGDLDAALPLAEQAAQGVEKRRFEMENAEKVMRTVIDCHEQLKQFDQAHAWRRKWLAVLRERAGARSMTYATELWQLVHSLWLQQNWAEVEAALREYLPIVQREQPDAWTTFNAQSMLGGAVQRQQKYADAEPLLVAGYEGMKQRAATIPAPVRYHLTQAADRLIRLYVDWGKSDEADRWCQEREALPRP